MMRYGILAAFILLLGILGFGLGNDPKLIPSPLIGKPLPEFDLPRVRFPEQHLKRADLIGKLSLVNVWATWCVGCRQEHPLLVQIANSGKVPLYGINYKDQRPAAIEWLDTRGDPYVASGYDDKGRTGLELGVYGLPETFLVDTRGTIVYKHIGPLDETIWREKFLPLLNPVAVSPS